MDRTFTKLCVLVAGLVVLNYGHAQLSITGQAGGLKFLGDVGQKNNSNFFSDMRLGYNLGLEYRFGKVLGIGIDGLYGNLAGTDNDKTSHLNFQSQVMGGALNVYGFFDRLGEKEKEVSPYVHAGFGYLMFDPYGDLRDKNGTYYNYWSDGSIRNLAESTQNEPISMIIKRDYNYETQLKDSAVNYARNTFYIPLGVGAKFNMGFRASLRVGVVYNLCLSDYLDNYKKGGNDSWASANIALNFNFAKKPKDGSNINFKDIDNSDLDGDGVKDVDDRCQGTPKGIKVDGKGCPDDSDNDGVFDYMDKEPNSKRGAKVDAMGVTIDEELMAKRQLEWDSLASERSEGFNAAPSVTYLETVESKSKENKALTGVSTKIPAELVPADLNKDGYISAKEIKETINSFFEGDNSFNVEKINRLIDFFFEQ